MTYNFDPDKWYDDELSIIQAKQKKGEIPLEKYDLAVSKLDQKFADMWERLDGTYVIERNAGDKRYCGK
ncbi:MAG: hypothetical protein ABR534_08440 [Desulfotignum sp.]